MNFFKLIQSDLLYFSEFIKSSIGFNYVLLQISPFLNLIFFSEGALLSKDFKPYSVAGGVTAKIIKKEINTMKYFLIFLINPNK